MMKNLLKPEPELRRGYKDPKRLGYVAQYKCVCCEMLNAMQKTRLNVHHFWGTGAGKKQSDLLTFPLCEIHHNLLHSALSKFEEDFKPQSEFIGIINERIFNDNVLTGKQLRAYELVKNWAENKLVAI